MARRDLGVVCEFEAVDLGDARLNARALSIVARLQEAPADSFPDQMADDAELEATYRFFANQAVTLRRLLAPHIAKTHARMYGHRLVRVLHDTTALRFDGDREGLGPLAGANSVHGFYAHVALAVSADERREPLGVLGVRTHVLEKESRNRSLSKADRVARARATPREDKLSSRWEGLATDVSKDLPVRAIHIMDREADDYAGFGEMLDAGLHFVIRASCGRRVLDGGTARDALAVQEDEIFRDVDVNPRSEKRAVLNRKASRNGRLAKLSIRYGTVTLKRGFAQSDHATLTVNAVHVFEPKPPYGDEPIEWMLFTSEPVTTREQAEAIVDHYRARWVIEEYFKALKTGCAFEKRQLTSYQGLMRALGLLAPVAWRLLVLRNLGRVDAPQPASSVFDNDEIALLRQLAARRKRPLPEAPTIRDAMLAVAAVGGHLRSNGDPGWQVLGRGYRKFLDAIEGWRLAKGCDQS